MRHQARRFQPVAFLLLGAAHVLAQANKQPNEPPPPPAPVAEYSAKSWKEFSSPEGRFSVLMVGVPQQQSQDVDTALGKITLHVFGAESGAGTYVVMYGDFPAYPKDPASTRRALDGGRDQMPAAEKNDRLLGEKEITVEGHIARELFVEDGRTFIRMWMFMVSSPGCRVA